MTANDGQKWKKQTEKEQLDNLCNLVASTHSSVPKAGDLVKTGATLEGHGFGYNTAWRKLKEEDDIFASVSTKSFELTIPFLEEV